MAVGTTAVRTADAEEPSIAQLIEGVPNLTTTDPKLTAFSVRLTTSVPFGIPFETTAMWRKDGDVGLLTSAGEGQAPVWFLSDSQAAFFDVCTGSVLIKDDARLKLDLQLAGGELRLDYGIGSGDKDHVDVRLRPFFDHADIREGSLSRAADGALVLDSKVSARGFQTIAVFDEKEPHSLRSFEIKRVDGDSSVLRVHDLRLNDEVDVRWPPLPASDAFPNEIRVAGPDKDDDDPDADTQRLWLTRSQIGYAALRDVKWRDAPAVADVDWTAANEYFRSFESLGSKLSAEAGGDKHDER
jgi:hypothetical protein